MIPKKIHYVWVGRNPKSPLIEECLVTWRKKLTDYEIIEWNEDNFDIHQNRYLEKAYQEKKWAFVSDYIRAQVIYEQGGVYLDTDVRILKKLDPLLNNRAFIGFENNDYLSAAIFGAEAGHPFMQDILDYYKERDFVFDKNDQMAGVNSLSVTEILKEKYQLKTGNNEQILKDDIHIYPDGYLCNPSSDSYSIHLFTGTWIDGEQSVKQKIVTNLKRKIASPKQASLYQKINSKIMNQAQLQKVVEEISLEYFHAPFKHEVKINNRMTTTGGRYFLNDHHIDINGHFLDEKYYSDLVGIIKHELTHYHLHLAHRGYKHQDHDFKIMLAKVGGSRYTPDIGLRRKLKRNYVYECENCHWRYPRVRKVNTRKYRCGKCGGKLVLK